MIAMPNLRLRDSRVSGRLELQAPRAWLMPRHFVIAALQTLEVGFTVRPFLSR